jgi:alpha-1,3-rhamnosyl/mannosyltransferase
VTGVAVNLLWLRPGVVGGSEEYLCRQLAGLGEIDHPYALTLFTVPGFAAAHPELASFPAVRAPVGRVRPLRVAAEATWVPAMVRRRGVALVHHGGGTAPAVRAGVPVVLTIHDLQYRRYPENFSVVKRRWLRLAVPRSVRRAAVVCVPSEYVRATVVDAFAVPAERVVVVPHGLPELRPVAPSAEADLRERYDLPGRVVVYPAITYAHKNHVVLVRALARLARSHADVRLVLLGGVGPAETALRAEVERLGLDDRVVRPGRVSDADRDGLYALASGLAFPSRYEGFGAPVLEAMAAGVPVVASACAALPEVVGAGGLLVDPDDPAGWAEALAMVLDDPAGADILRAAGRARASGFTARRSAAALVHAYGPALA